MGRSDHNIDFITMINSIINNSAHTFTDYKMGFGIKDPTTCRFPQYICKFDVAFYIKGFVWLSMNSAILLKSEKKPTKNFYVDMHMYIKKIWITFSKIRVNNRNVVQFHSKLLEFNQL